VIITLKIYKHQIEKAETYYPFSNLKNSVTNGESQLYGALGEIIIYDYFSQKGYKIDTNSTYDYDMIIDGYKVEVKSTKTKAVPKENYICGIMAYNFRQECDFYFFLRINTNLKECYLLGYKSKSDFKNEATFIKKGEKDQHGFIIQNDNYILEINKLNQFK
jgi:hypothetical protein